MHKAGVCHRDLKLENLVRALGVLPFAFIVFLRVALPFACVFHCISLGLIILPFACVFSLHLVAETGSALRCCSCLTRPARYSS